MFTKIKILGLGLISLLFLTIDWVLINSALFGDKPLLFWIWPGIVTVLAIAFLTLFALVNSDKMFAYGFGLVSFILYGLVFPKNWLVILAGLVFLILMFWFEKRIRTEEAARQYFSIRNVSAAGINVIIFAFLFSISLNVYYHIAAQFRDDPEAFYQALGKSAAKSTRYLGDEKRLGIDLTQSLDQYLLEETKRQNPDFNSVSPDFQKQYLEQAKQDFFRQFNVNFASDIPMSEVVAQFAVDQVRQTTEKNKNIFPLIFTLIIFALLRTFSFVLRWSSVLVTWLFYQLLLRIGFFRLSKVAVEVEKLEI